MTDRNRALRLLPRLIRIWADGGYRGSFIDTVQHFCHWGVEIVLRLDDVRGFQVLPKRRIVERTFAWLLNFRRLNKDYEYRPVASTGMIYAAMIRLMLRRLA